VADALRWNGFTRLACQTATHPCAIFPLCESIDAIQNGAPDAIAIEQHGQILWSIEYDFALPTSMCSLVPVFPQFTSPLQTPAADSETVAGSIQLCSGAWGFTAAATPCSENGCVTSSVPDFVESLPWGVLKDLYRE
jgi:hypothetical protein